MPKKIELSVETKDPLFFSRVSQIKKLSQEIKERESVVSTLSDHVKEVAKREWTSLYQKMGNNPGSLRVYATKEDETSSVLFVPSDRYISLNENNKKTIEDQLGEEVIQESREWSISGSMVEKYLPLLKDFIESSSHILDEDRPKILQETLKFSIKPGTIDRLDQFGEVDKVFETIKPVVSLKSIDVKKNVENPFDI
ncbi:hypothetical protein EBU71_02280 [bacterium]|nr:hypothetical protein [Candidatus Elulimicrobium humile]